MKINVVNHPLLAHALITLRDKDTPNELFRSTMQTAARMLAYEATRDLESTQTKVETPLAVTMGDKLNSPGPVIVPILRAGLGISDALIELIPTAELGMIGIKRDEETAEPHVYLEKIPADLSGRTVFIADPMLATGGSLNVAVDHVKARGCTDIRVVCLVASPEGISNVEKNGVDIELTIAAIDESLNDQAYIVPGLGDAGDRMFGPNN